MTTVEAGAAASADSVLPPERLARYADTLVRSCLRLAEGPLA